MGLGSEFRDPEKNCSGSWIPDPGSRIRISNSVRNPPDTFPFLKNPFLASTVVPPPHCAAVSDDLLTAKEKNKKMEEEMEAAFQDIQNM
jgi:hypothetical protein